MGPNRAGASLSSSRKRTTRRITVQSDQGVGSSENTANQSMAERAPILVQAALARGRMVGLGLRVISPGASGSGEFSRILGYQITQLRDIFSQVLYRLRPSHEIRGGIKIDNLEAATQEHANLRLQSPRAGCLRSGCLRSRKQRSLGTCCLELLARGGEQLHGALCAAPPPGPISCKLMGLASVPTQCIFRARRALPDVIRIAIPFGMLSRTCYPAK